MDNTFQWDSTGGFSVGGVLQWDDVFHWDNAFQWDNAGGFSVGGVFQLDNVFQRDNVFQKDNAGGFSVGGGRVEWEESAQYPPFHSRICPHTSFYWIQEQHFECNQNPM